MLIKVSSERSTVCVCILVGKGKEKKRKKKLENGSSVQFLSTNRAPQRYTHVWAPFLVALSTFERCALNMFFFTKLMYTREAIQIK